MKSALIHLFRETKSRTAFTLIELLVVIGILGILAAALVATIDPFEQLKKASDSNDLNTSVEFYNSILRYYTTHNAFPWATTANGGADCNGATNPSGTALNASAFATCLTTLTSEGELKSAFSTAQNLKNVYVTNSAGSNTVIVCFKPTSKSQQKNKAAVYTDATGTADSTNTCKANGGTTDCYWCTQ